MIFQLYLDSAASLLRVRCLCVEGRVQRRRVITSCRQTCCPLAAASGQQSTAYRKLDARSERESAEVGAPSLSCFAQP